MLINHFKIALRALLRFKGYSIVNLAGLCLGLTTAVLILLHVLDEAAFDRFHTNRERIYRVETQFVDAKSGVPSGANETNGWAVGHFLRKDFPEVQSVLYTRNASFLLVNHNGKHIREQVHFASPEFFEIFSFPLVAGNSLTALNEPFSVVLTERAAKKYFPNGDALSKTMMFADTLQFVVTGVMKDIPDHSHIQLDMLMSFSTYTNVLDRSFDYNGGWGNMNMRNYILLKEGVNVESFKSKAKSLYVDHAGAMLKEWGTHVNVIFQPMTSLYLTSESGNGMGPIGSAERLYLLSGIAVFVLLLAAINFINLTTARAVYRAKEVGLRKVVGSTRQALVRQFLSESFAVTFIALVVAIALSGMLLPLFNQLLSKHYTVSSLFQWPVLLGMLALLLIVTLLSGYYPSLVMSKMKPVDVLKGKLQNSNRGVQLRRALVVFQFVISVSLVLGTLIVIQQLNYMQSQDLGFAKDEVFVVNAARIKSNNPKAFETFKNDLQSLSMVNRVSFANSLPGNPGWLGQIAYPEGKSGDDAVTTEYMAVDDDYISTLGLELIAGRNFDQSRPAALENGLILNETAVTAFGWASPNEAIGKKITSPSGTPAGEVIGVVKDYHQFGLQQNVGPMAMDYNPDYSYMYAIRYDAVDTKSLIVAVDDLWSKHFPGYDFNYFFLDQDFEKQYQSEQRLGQVFTIFALITVIIAAIGLLGLVSFMVTARNKEIGIRKVLGAEVIQITTLLSKEFVILVVIANAIAFPIGWFFAQGWLEQFASRMDLSPWLFVFTFTIAIGVTLLTIGFQTIKAALKDPVASLRYE